MSRKKKRRRQREKRNAAGCLTGGVWSPLPETRIKKPRRPRWHISQAIDKAKLLAHPLKMRASLDGDEIAFSDADTGEILLWWTGQRWRTEGHGGGMCRLLEVAVETAYDVMRGVCHAKG